MDKLTSFYVFVSITKHDITRATCEKMLMMMGSSGIPVPMVYASEENINELEIDTYLNIITKEQDVTIELREYMLVDTVKHYHNGEVS